MRMNKMANHTKADFKVNIMCKKNIWLLLVFIIVFGMFVIAALDDKDTDELVRLPTKLASIDGRYYSFIERNPKITNDNLHIVSKRPQSNDKTCLYGEIIMFGRSLKLDKKISLNAAMHGLMTFGPNHPIYINEGKKIPVLEFIRNYYDYLPIDIREHSPAWIHRVENEYFLTISYTPRIISDHLGQLVYICALSEIPIETTFKLKSGDYISLEKLLKTQMKYADPDIHDPTWQTAALAYYRPDKTWKSINKRNFSSFDFLEKTSSYVEGHVTCGHTHSLISAAYALSKLKATNNVINKHRLRLENCQQNLDYWVNVIRKTLYPDGTVSQRWYLNEKVYPKSMNETIILNGHILEWLATYLDKEQLGSPWVTKIVDRFCETVAESINTCSSNNSTEQLMPFEYAPLCHGIRGLLAYCEKMQIDLNIVRSDK